VSGLAVVVLTGAGVSADSGVATFRGAGGMWEGTRIEDVATPHAWRRDPERVWRFYQLRRAALASVAPNAAHLALARLERALAAAGASFTLVTQNVDDLHERAGSRNLVHMHGELRRALCLSCGARPAWDGDLIGRPACPACGERMLRPDVVWFGEIPYDMDEIHEALFDCDVFCSIGTSGQVYPAAGFVQYALARRAETIELNLAASDASTDFHVSRRGPASELVPAWVEELLGR
jgi:NAD-dependent deacetylase